MRRDFRWTALILAACAIGAVSFFGFWLIKRPSLAALEATITLAEDVESLSSSLDDLGAMAGALGSGKLTQDYATALAATEDSSRALFTAAAALPPQNTEARAEAADAAAAALDVTRRFAAAIAFMSALEPALSTPLLTTEPELIGLTEAAAYFAEWRATLDETSSVLADGVDDTLKSEFNDFRVGLSVTQTAYVDAIRAQDRMAAQRVADHIEDQLEALRQRFVESYLGFGAETTAIIAETQSRLARLVD